MMKLQLIFLAVILFDFSASEVTPIDCSNQDSLDPALKLKKKLICNYDKDTAPDHGQGPLGVDVSVTLQQFEFNSDSRTMEIQIWMSISWADSRLKWAIEENSRIFQTFVPFDMLWVPDITLFKSDTLEDINSCTATNCFLSSDGGVRCLLPCEFSMYCANAEYSNWPFDYANCIFAFTSRTKSAEKIIFKSFTVNMNAEAQTQNRAWELTSFSGSINSQKNELMAFSENPKANYSSLMMRIIIGRHNKDIVLHLMVPALLIVVLNIVTLILDGDQPERWVLYGIYLFAHYIYFEQLSWMLPPNSDSIPHVFSHFCNSYYITIFLLIESVLMKVFIESMEMTKTFMTIMDKSTNSYIGQLILRKDIGDVSATRKNFCCLIDRVLIFLLIIFYGYSFTTLMPIKGGNKTPFNEFLDSE